MRNLDYEILLISNWVIRFNKKHRHVKVNYYVDSDTKTHVICIPTKEFATKKFTNIFQKLTKEALSLVEAVIQVIPIGTPYNRSIRDHRVNKTNIAEKRSKQLNKV